MEDMSRSTALVCNVLLFSFPTVILAFTLHLLMIGSFLACAIWAATLAFLYWLYQTYFRFEQTDSVQPSP